MTEAKKVAKKSAKKAVKKINKLYPEARIIILQEPKSHPEELNKIKELGSTKAMFFGHDHINNFEVDYQGVKFCYGIKSTDRIYHDVDMMGCQTITIHDDHSLKIDRYYHTYAEVK